MKHLIGIIPMQNTYTLRHILSYLNSKYEGTRKNLQKNLEIFKF